MSEKLESPALGVRSAATTVEPAAWIAFNSSGDRTGLSWDVDDTKHWKSRGWIVRPLSYAPAIPPEPSRPTASNDEGRKKCPHCLGVCNPLPEGSGYCEACKGEGWATPPSSGNADAVRAAFDPRDICATPSEDLLRLAEKIETARKEYLGQIGWSGEMQYAAELAQLLWNDKGTFGPALRLAALSSAPEAGEWQDLAKECRDCALHGAVRMSIYTAHSLLVRAADALSRSNRGAAS